MGTKDRSVLAVIASVAALTGVSVCLTRMVLGFTVGGVLLLIAALMFTSLLYGWPLSWNHEEDATASMEGIPLHAPTDYQVEQLRQVIPYFEGAEFGEFELTHLIPKVSRSSRRSPYEPLHGAATSEGLDRLVETGELILIKPATWRATEVTPPKRRLR